jgi:catechol 2,3-dioxygenase-like lactoylglutathione lyase family enzyme
MSIRLGNVTVLVRDYGEALRFYTEVLEFEKRSDQPFGPGARWVTVAAPGQDVQILLQKPEPAMHGDEAARKMMECIGRNPT